MTMPIQQAVTLSTSAVTALQQILQILVALPGETLAEVQNYLLLTRPVGTQTNLNPWLRFGGEWGDETEWAQIQADIAAFRQTIDQSASLTVGIERGETLQ